MIERLTLPPSDADMRRDSGELLRATEQQLERAAAAIETEQAAALRAHPVVHNPAISAGVRSTCLCLGTWQD